MFLIHDNNNQFVFTDSDPLDDGFTGKVFRDVTLVLHPNPAEWPEGGIRPEPVLGVSTTHSNQYEVFGSRAEAVSAKYQVLGQHPRYASSYAAYLHSVLPPIPYNIRTYLDGVWNNVGPSVLKKGGIEAPSQSCKRRLLRAYMDGEPITNENYRKFWKPLTDHQKTLHLFNLFPDEPTFVE